MESRGGEEGERGGTGRRNNENHISVVESERDWSQDNKKVKVEKEREDRER